MMDKKEGLDCKISEIAEEIREIRGEVIWIRNKIIEIFPMSYTSYNPNFIIKGCDPSHAGFFNPETIIQSSLKV